MARERAVPESGTEGWAQVDPAELADQLAVARHLLDAVASALEELSALAIPTEELRAQAAAEAQQNEDPAAEVQRGEGSHGFAAALQLLHRGIPVRRELWPDTRRVLRLERYPYRLMDGDILDPGRLGGEARLTSDDLLAEDWTAARDRSEEGPFS